MTNVRWNISLVAQGVAGIPVSTDSGVNLGGPSGIAPGASATIQAITSGNTNAWRDYMVYVADGTWPFTKFIGLYRIQPYANTNYIDVVGEWCKTGCRTNTLPAPMFNRSAMPQIGKWHQDGVLKKQSTIQPGTSDSYTFEWCVDDGDPNLAWGMSATIPQITDLGDGNFDVGGATVGSGTQLDLGGGGSSLPLFTNSIADNFLSSTNWPINSDNPFGSTATGLTNGYPIVWNNPDSTAARDATLKAGFNKLSSQNDSIINGLLLVNQTINNQSNGGSSVTVNITNINSLQSNMPAFYSDDYWSLTNHSSSTNGGGAAMSSASGTVGGLTNNGSILTPGTGEPHSWVIEFMGQSVDFNPFTRWPAIATTSRWAWGLAAIIAFLIWSSAFIKTEVVSQMATMQTGGVPNMQMEGEVMILGTGLAGGGNFLGMAVAIGVRVVITALFAAAMVYGAGLVNSEIEGYLSSYVASTVPGTFWYIANLLIPVSLIFGLTAARVTIPLAAGSAQAITIGALRWLPGK